jgi:hypothetical protein
VLGAGQSAVIADVSEDTAFPIDERMRILGGRPARLGASRRRSPAKAQRPPVGGGTDRQHGWQTTDPLCWRYAGCEILAILAQFRELRLGSGPRGRRFKSSRPDQFLRKPAESRLPGHSVPRSASRVGTECSVLQIGPSSRIVRDFSPPSLATGLSRPFLQAKCYPPRYPTARSDTASRTSRLIG